MTDRRVRSAGYASPGVRREALPRCTGRCTARRGEAGTLVPGDRRRLAAKWSGIAAVPHGRHRGEVMSGVGLSERDRQVLGLVAAARVVSADQIERACFPADIGSDLSAARRCRRVLVRLTEGQYLRRLNRRIGGSSAGSSGFLYRIGGRGRAALGLPGRAGRWEPGERFVAHHLAVAQVHVDLLAAETKGQVTDLCITHEPDTWRRYLDGEAVTVLKPDLLVELSTPDGWALRWWVEVDRSTEHLPTVLRKAERYERYWRSGAEVRRHPVFPRVLWSVPDEGRAEQLRAGLADGRHTSGLFVVVTAEETTSQLMRGGTQ